MNLESKNAEAWEHIETNLLRYRPNGKYYVKAKIRGRKVRECLDTDKLALARRKLTAWMTKVRGGTSKGKSALTLPGLEEEYKAWLANKVQASRTTDYRLECLGDIASTWPGYKFARVAGVTRHQVESWRDSLLTKHQFSRTRANGMLGTLRQMCDLAEKLGYLLHDPPTTRVKGLAVKPKAINLPTSEEFERIKARVYERSPAGGQLFEFLALSGCRIESACNVKWEHVNGQTLTFVKAKRGGYSIPLFPSLKAFLDKIKPANCKSGDRILRVDSIKRSLGETCAELGLPHLTHHDLRHWFATRCIELGVDIPTLSRWLGHKDGGALAMRVYGHLRDEHSQKMAQLI